MSNIVKIHTDQKSPRSNYVFDLIFKELLGVDYEYVASDEADLNYSTTQSEGLHCVPHGLLTETTLRETIKDEIHFGAWLNSNCFFRTGGELPYDIFSAAFYLTSRYEEYLDFQADAHNRFPAEESVLHKAKLLEEPLVNQWALILKEALIKVNPSLQFYPRSFEFISTLDIDQAWKFKNKGFRRNLGGLLRDVVKLDFKQVKERMAVMFNLKEDPFFNFDWQEQVHSANGIESRYFILLGSHSEFDKNISPDNIEFQSLIRHINSYSNSRIGIHPSYQSNYNSDLIQKEIKRLSDICEAEIDTSRQHFLMHEMPNTYEHLEHIGIVEEHTMGYSTHFGFRAGIAAPFYFYNLEFELKTSMKLYPFCAMDITPLHYRGESPEQAKIVLDELMDKVKAVGGLFIPLWHNESLSESGRWKNWRMVYQHIIEQSNA